MLEFLCVEMCKIIESKSNENKDLRGTIIGLEASMAAALETIASTECAVDIHSVTADGQPLDDDELRQVDEDTDRNIFDSARPDDCNSSSSNNGNTDVDVDVVNFRVEAVFESTGSVLHDNSSSFHDQSIDPQDLLHVEESENLIEVPISTQTIEVSPSYKVDIGCLSSELYRILTTGAVFMKKSSLGFKNQRKILISNDLRFLLWGTKGSTKLKVIPLACFEE